MTSTRTDLFTETIIKRRLVMDGAMGTMLMNNGYNRCADLAVLDSPDTVATIHRQYLEAGADIIETNTFNATATALSRYGLSAHAREINMAAAKIARREADHCGNLRWVAGSVGPTHCMLSREDTSATAQLSDDYFNQIKALIEGGVDLIAIESVCDAQNAFTAISAAAKAMEQTGTVLPVMVSVTPTTDGRLYSGETVADFAARISRIDIVKIVGANCGYGPQSVIDAVKEMAATRLKTVAAPNAGLPDKDGRYSLTPQQFADSFTPLLDNGLPGIAGGCCGTTPDHIAALYHRLRH